MALLEVQHVTKSFHASGREPLLALDDVLWSRIETFPPLARRLLEVVAVSGRPLRLADASEAAGMNAEARETLALLRAGRLVRSIHSTDHELIETYHDRVRETVMAHLTPLELARSAAPRLPVAARPLRSLAEVTTTATYAPPDEVEELVHPLIATEPGPRRWCRQVERIAADSMTTGGRLRRYFTVWR